MNLSLLSILIAIEVVAARVPMPDNTERFAWAYNKGAGCKVPVGSPTYVTATTDNIFDIARDYGVSKHTGAPLYGRYTANPEGKDMHDPLRYVHVDFYYGEPDTKPGSLPWMTLDKVYTNYPEPIVS